MIDLLVDGILRIIGRAATSRSRAWRGDAVVGARHAPAVVPSAVVERRAHGYAALAVARGLTPDGRVDAHGVHYRGAHRGRETLFTTGILPDDPPTYPELQIWTSAVKVAAPVLLTPSSTASCVPEIDALLEEEDVHNIGVTDRFVRIRFEPGIPVALVEQAWDALEHALAGLERVANSRDAAPYRA